MAPATTAPDTIAVAANCAWVEDVARDSQVDIEDGFEEDGGGGEGSRGSSSSSK
jgi:hypothetical protein